MLNSDMSDAIAVAEGLLKGGGVPLSRDQLAAAMSLAPGGGGFATKIATARTFGVIEPTAGKYQLTELGFEIVDPSRQQGAKVRAFLSVELYKKVYEEFRGKLLSPRPHGLEATFVTSMCPRKTRSPRGSLSRNRPAWLASFRMPQRIGLSCPLAWREPGTATKAGVRGLGVPRFRHRLPRLLLRRLRQRRRRNWNISLSTC